MSYDVPTFFVYGEPDRPVDVGFIHVETVMSRSNVHLGQVKAHKHDRMAQITFWTKGHGRYFIEDMSLDFFAPTISYVPSGVVHGFKVEPADSDAIVVSIADGALLTIGNMTVLPLDEPVLVNTSPGDEIWSRIDGLMRRVAEEYREDGMGTDHVMASLAAIVLTEIARLVDRRPAIPHSGAVSLATNFKRLADEHFRTNMPIGYYYKQLGTTPHLLAKACKKSFGKSPKEVLDDRRLLEAKRLLMFTVRSVEDIAFEIGFKDAAYFSRFFSMRMGEPPGKWRQAP